MHMTTMHRVEGLEFDHMLPASLNAGLVLLLGRQSRFIRKSMT